MSIEQLDLLLCDTYQMDAWFPLGWKWKKELEKSSYSVWAIDELKRYIVGRLYPKKSGSVEDFITFVGDFQFYVFSSSGHIHRCPGFITCYEIKTKGEHDEETKSSKTRSEVENLSEKSITDNIVWSWCGWGYRNVHIGCTCDTESSS